MPSPLRLLPIVVAQQSGRQVLERKEEPSGVTAAAANVVQYDRVMTTKLAVAYAAGLEVVHRARPPAADAAAGEAADLACGPGHYTLCLARYMDYRVTGIDLSPGMVETATRNAAQAGLAERVRFVVGDVTRIGDALPTARPMKPTRDGFDLASFTDAAHHMPDLETVGQVLRQMDCITRPDGLVMVMDLVRLRTARITERYVHTLGHDYVERGLPAFLEDFRNSMYAAWTVSELHQAIPTGSRRWWCHVAPRGLPTVQIILGLPVGRTRLFVRSGQPWPKGQSPVSREMRTEWNILRWSLRFANRWWVSPARGNP